MMFPKFLFIQFIKMKSFNPFNWPHGQDINKKVNLESPLASISIIVVALVLSLIKSWMLCHTENISHQAQILCSFKLSHENHLEMFMGRVCIVEQLTPTFILYLLLRLKALDTVV